jgi:hypothetical protein
MSALTVPEDFMFTKSNNALKGDESYETSFCTNHDTHSSIN